MTRDERKPKTPSLSGKRVFKGTHKRRGPWGED